MKKIKVLVASPEPSDATSMYRAFGPMHRLVNKYTDVEIIRGGIDAKDYNWDTLMGVDVLFFQRPALPLHAQIIQLALTLGIPVWIDYDDDLMSVPKENPCAEQYNKPEIQHTIKRCLKLATYVSVSTEKLKEKFSEFNSNIEVIPNALDDTLFQMVKAPENTEKVIFWRGSHTHQGDLMAYKDEILQVAEENPDWKWYFLGYEPWFLTEKMKPGSYGVAPWASHMDYFGLIQRLRPQILMVPLKFDEFNHGKSHIAWLEGTLAGAAVLGPDFTEWDRPGCMTYNSHFEFKDRLTDLIQQPGTRNGLRLVSKDTIEAKYLLSQTNVQRYQAILKLAKRVPIADLVYPPVTA